MQVSLLITTYNRPKALNLVLQSVAQQIRQPDEVIICDDGSGTATSEVVSAWLCKMPVRHTWDPDKNFRAALTRNLGILKSNADLLIFVDGDCLLPPSFVENHCKLAQPGLIISGGRLLLDRAKTRLVLDGDISLPSIFHHWKFSHLALGPIRDLKPRNWEAVRTCNLSLHRQDILNIAGFDQSYVGWGREDSDFVVRLMRSGVKIRSGRFAASVAHLHHSESPRNRLSANDQRFQATLDNPKHTLACSSII